MHIAVVSDTHNRVVPQLFELLSEADEIWHLGDVCDEHVLDEFRAIGAPLKIVRGNCDACLDWPLTLDLTGEELKILLVHIPPPLRQGAPPGTDLLLHGHTHVPRNERVGDAIFLNPGCITRPNRGAPRSFAWLDLQGGKKWSWHLHVLEQK